MRSIRFLIASCCLSALFFFGPGTAAAEEYSRKGRNLFTPGVEEVQELPGGGYLSRLHYHGFNISENPNDPLHLAAMDCIGLELHRPDGTWTGSGTCQHIDSDGDILWDWWQGDATGGTWGYTRGTGKFAGATGSGTWSTAETEFPDGRWIVPWEGTLITK